MTTLERIEFCEGKNIADIINYPTFLSLRKEGSFIFINYGIDGGK